LPCRVDNPVVSLDADTVAVGSVVAVATLLPAVTHAVESRLAPVVPTAAGVAALLAVPAAAVGLWGGVDPDRFRSVAGWVVAVATLAAVVATAALADPGDAPVVGAGVLVAGVAVWVGPLAVGAMGAVPFGRVVAAWSPAVLVGVALFVLGGGVVWDGLLYGLPQAVGAAGGVVCLVGPAGLARLVDRVRRRGGRAAGG
jgi:hypothetical protein